MCLSKYVQPELHRKIAAIKRRCTLVETTSASRVVIRRADEGDFEWVASTMELALGPFYGGDHRAHAQRIFDTHINGSVDYVGHFSAEQHMFIAELESKRVGLIHLVVKKQETVKISPLIVDPESRGKFGVGSLLLKHAEQFAKYVGARQLYCTVAAPNHTALGFFLRQGFRIAGTAQDHYKRGADEHMLYKQLIEDTDLTAPNISVIPFNAGQHANEAREIILQVLRGDFLGVDDAWVDALFTGYERRNSTNINTKYKLIFIAESGGKVVGVAGATPKKGDPIKLMPLVATSESAFEALIIDLQGLLADYGHKLYVHLAPAAWQVACLQRHGWTLEGVFPGGYAPNSVVQQWGLSIGKGRKTMNTMRIKRPYYDAIMAGEKTLEVRVGYTNIRRCKPGELLLLETSQVSSVVKIKAVRTYESLEAMLAAEKWQQIMPDAANNAAALSKLRDIYPPTKEAFGVYVFEIELVAE